MSLLWRPVNLRVSLTLAQELARYIRLLALRGKKLFIHFVYDPLSYAGYPTAEVSENVLRLTEKISQSLKSQAAGLDLKIRLLISRAMRESLSALGDSLLFLLENSARYPLLASNPELLRIVNILGPSLYEFMQKQKEKDVHDFETRLNQISFEEAQKTLESISLGKSISRADLDHRIRALYTQISLAARKDDLNRCLRLLGDYMIRYGDDESYQEAEVKKILDALKKRDANFENYVKDYISVQLYYLISKSISQGDLKQAVAGIRKYAHIFQGDPNVRFYYEIDRMERVMYKIIKEKNLWKELGVSHERSGFKNR